MTTTDCDRCKPPVPELDSVVRTGPDHYGVRFGHIGQVKVILDGRDVTNDAYEAMAGDQGWALLYDKPEGHVVACQASRVAGDVHAVAHLHRGRVVVIGGKG